MVKSFSAGVSFLSSFFLACCHDLGKRRNIPPGETDLTLLSGHAARPSLRAKRSNPFSPPKERMDCFVATLLAMTVRAIFLFNFQTA
jgi:hypothetical protein